MSSKDFNLLTEMRELTRKVYKRSVIHQIRPYSA